MPYAWTYRVLSLLGLFAMGLNLNGCSHAGSDAASKSDPTSAKTIDGKVNGLSGTLELKTDDGTTITVSNNKVFTLRASTTSQAPEISVLVQPVGQTCTVTVGSANAEGIVTDVTVNCITNTYPVGGSITGLKGSVVLQNNLGDSFTASANNDYSFPTSVPHGGRYSATVLTQPDGQICTINNGTGLVTAAITNIGVYCADRRRAEGTLSGLNQGFATLVLQENGGLPLALTANGPFSFPAAAVGVYYSVTIFTQPWGQTCNISNGAGTYDGPADTGISVTCTTNAYSVGGSISGLHGPVVLQNNSGDNTPLLSDGDFNFARSVLHGGSYSVTLYSQPSDQSCAITNGNGSINGANITNVSVVCVAKTFIINGVINGLTGTLELVSNGAGKITATANGAIKFPSPILYGTSYVVSISKQPDTQSCSVFHGLGTANAEVNDLTINCENTYTVGGTISGLIGTVVLQNNGVDSNPVSTNGPFTFASRISHGKTYAVTIRTQPPGQTCAVAKDTGTATTNVTQVVVTCAASSYSIGGTVNGLNGSVTIQNNTGDKLTTNSSGVFTFSTNLIHGSAYATTVLSQPVGQTCTISNGSGTALAPVSNIIVNCAANTYSIGGTLSGLVGTVVLRNNGGNDLTLASNGGFAFSTKLAHGTLYTVTVFTQASGQTCSVLSGSAIATTTVSQISVNCISLPPSLRVSSSTKQLRFSWTPMIGATYYKLLGNSDGTSGFIQVGANLTTTTANLDVAVHKFNWLKASYLVSACNSSNICSDSNSVFPLAEAVKAIGYIKADNTGAGDAFGVGIALSGDGKTLAVAANLEDSATTGTISISNESAADAGAVYIYTNASGSWVQQAYIKASNPGAGDLFGTAVALSADGNTLAVGANSEDSNSTGTNPSFNDLAAGAGAVYVFTRAANVWTQQAFLKASNSGIGDEFGRALSLAADGKTIAIGAIYEDSSTVATPNELATDSGAVYIFTLEYTGWRQTGYIKASNIGSGDLFGSSVALSPDGNTLAVGAPLEDGDNLSTQATPNDASQNSGATYIYVRNTNTWTQQAYLKASNVGSGDAFGSSVALSNDGNTLAVGATAEASSNVGINGIANELTAGSGAVYVYTRANSLWSQQAFVKASNAGAGDTFGTSVTLSADGNTLAVGATGEDSSATGINGATSESATDSGATYLYTRTNGTWSLISFIKAANTDAGDSFGGSVNLSSDGNTLLVGAKAENGNGVGLAADRTNNASTSAGAAYLY